MCGIVGYVGEQQCVNILMNSLSRLEYRGYDSAGVAVLAGGQTRMVRSVGKLSQLKERLRAEPLLGCTGIAHTRWATHGAPNERNAHPHQSGKITVVHNGIVENHRELRAALQAQGRRFNSETDTEIFAHLIDLRVQAGMDMVEALREALQHIRGSYAIAALNNDQPGVIYVAKEASPLVIGLGDRGNLIASDVPALLPYTRRVIYLRDSEIAVLTSTQVKVSTLAGEAVEIAPVEIHWDVAAAEKNGHKHFMHKEIHEQPNALKETLRGRIDESCETLTLPELRWDKAAIQDFDKIFIIACGTSNHAGMVAKYWFEELTQIPVETDIASEFRYRNPIMDKRSLAIFISQSGETADTLAALKMSRDKGATTLAISNVMDSSIARHAHHVLYTQAGPEIGVASTKAFMTQLLVLFLLGVHLGRARDTLSRERAVRYLDQAKLLPAMYLSIFKQEDSIVEMARRFVNVHDWLFLGRWVQFPIALEGALKLKEISYAHAEGYAAGEMKHGPIALIHEDVVVVSICTRNRVYEKVLSNVQEAKARGGQVMVIATEGDPQILAEGADTIWVPAVDELLEPLLAVLPLQLLAYHIADLRKLDVDQPRNLAKSVTVE